MEIREAILKAADHIQANPGEFDFQASYVPDCGTPGCALGWIGYFAGMKRGVTGNYQVSSTVFGFGSPDFYDRITELTSNAWHTSTTNCAHALRLYADKYHPETTEEYPAIRAELARIAGKVAA